MATRQQLNIAKTIKNKKVKVSRVAQQLADNKHMGDEPDVNGKSLQGIELLRVLNWYNYMCSRSDSREYVEAYLKANGRLDDLRALKQVPDIWINLQAGWFARIMTRGGDMGPDSVGKFNSRLTEMLERSSQSEEPDEVEKKDPPKPKATILDRMSDKASDIIGELDGMIDDKGPTIDVYDWLTKKQLPPAFARRIYDFFKPIAEEASEIHYARTISSKNACKQLIEGYARMSKAEVKQRAVFYLKLLADCERYADVAKKQKAPRKKKPVPVEKKLKGLKFQRESKEYKLASINPEKIIGAAELWVFNSKYRTLSVFHAASRDGLDVLGTTIKGYDPDRSKTYRVGRRTEEHVATALKGAKRPINKMLEELKTIDLQHRVNENTILLRAE